MTTAQAAPLAEQTPVDIDLRLETLENERAGIATDLDATYSAAHRLIGEQPTSQRGGITEWPTTDTEALARLRAHAVMPWEETEKARVFERIEKRTARLAEINREIDTIAAEYVRRPWPRYVLVPGGHIHASRACGSIGVFTQTLRVAHLSGQDAATAVAELKTAMCSHCFPDAPVELRQLQPVDDGKCRNKTPKPGSYNPRRAYPRGTCGTCGATEVSLTRLMNLRAHDKSAEVAK